MIEEGRQSIKQAPEQYDYDSNPQIQPQPNIWNKFFFFNRIHMLYKYISGGINRQTLLRYNDNFNPMFSTTTILQKYFKRKQGDKVFDITAQLFKMEKGPFIFLIFMSVISGCSSLVPIYFQSLLAKAVIGTSGDYYAIYVVGASILARFFLLNYTLNLSSNIGINVKLHLQNTFMRSIFYLEEDQYPALKGRIKYLDVDLIGQALFYIPYFITSIMLILGALAFTFIYVSPYSVIVIGIYLILWTLIGITGWFAYKNMKVSRRRVAQRQKYARRSIANLMNAAFERMHDYIYQLLVVEKTLQTKRNIKINLQYILGQTFGQMCIVLSVITFFALAHNGAITFQNAYYAVLFLTTTFYPMRYCVYGLFTAIKAFEAYRQIRNQLQTVSKAIIKDVKFSNVEHKSHVFAENIGDCFEYRFQRQQAEQQEQNNRAPPPTESNQELNQLQPEKCVSSSSLYNELEGLKIQKEKRKALHLPPLHNLQIKNGLVVMMICKVDAQISPQDYYLQLLIKKPLGSSATKITSKHFMLPDSLKNNICFYSPFNQELYHRVLRITQLQSLQREISSAVNKGGEEYIKFSEWHESRIQLARALYNNVDYLLIDKPLLLEDEQLLKKFLAERRANNKITLIANNTYWSYFKSADFILIIDKTTYEFGQLQKLKANPRSLLNSLFMHHEDVNHIQKIPQIGHKDYLPGVVLAQRVEDKPIQHLQKATFFQLFAFIHKKSQFIVIFALFAAPCFKYSMSYIIGKSTTTDIFWTYLILGLIYICLIFFRGLTLTLYTNYGSLALYQQICRKNRRLNAHQILELSQKPVVDIDYHQRIIDRNLVMDFEYGQSILIQIIVNFVVLCTGQPLYIAVAIPIIVGIVFCNANFARNAKKMYLLKLKQTKGVHKILALAVDKCQRIARYQKAPEINELFYKNNKVQTIYDLNIEWLQTGVRTMSEFVVCICFVCFLMIMVLTVKNQTSYTSLVSLGCSMFINLLYLNTFYLKAFRQTEVSLYSLTVVFERLKNPPNPNLRQVRRQQHFFLIKRIQHVQSIQYKDVSLRYFKNVCDKVNFSIREEDRVVLSGNSNSFKEMIFYMLKNKIFDTDEVRGDILINGKSYDQFIIDGLFYLHTDPLLPFFGTVYEALKLADPELNQGQLQALLLWFFNILGVEPLFFSDTPIEHLSLGKKQLFEVFKVLKIEKCKVLVIVDGLDHIDIVTRRRLTKFLIKNSDINILIETTNISQIVHLYPRRFIFNNLKITEEVLKQHQMQQQRKLLQSKQTMEMLVSHQNVPRHIKSAKTFASGDISGDKFNK